MLSRYRKFRSYGHGRVIAALNAPPLGWLLGLAAALGLLFGLGGCNPLPKHDPALGRQVAQDNLDKLEVACRDGVQYLVQPWQASSVTVVPRMKLDGTMYRCKIVNTAAAVREEWEGL